MIISKFQKLVLVICLVAVVFSCNSPVNTNITGNTYFDLTAYINQQIDFLNKAHPTLFVTATANDNTEQRRNKHPDWNRELRAFINSDIHQGSCTGRYTVDTQVIKTYNDTSCLVTYTSASEKLPTQKLEVYFTPDKKTVKRVHVTSQTKTLLSVTTEELDYTVGKGYHLLSSEQTLIEGTNTNEIRADFEFDEGFFQ